MRRAFSPPALRLFGQIGLVLCIALPFSAHAQQGPDSAQDDSNQKLLQRINELETKVKQLEEKQAPPAAPVAAAPAPAAPPPQPPAEVDIPVVNEVAPRLKLNVFGDVGAQGFDGIPSSFEFGSLDLFMRARLSDKVSVLGEVLFIAASDNSIEADVERLFLQYRQSDYFAASIGRFHTAIGYYNTAFNKGEFLETTTDRPFIYAFDDQGGVLPMQDVGVSVTGKVPSGKLDLNYIVEVSNGRGWGVDAEPAQNSQDANTSKAINGGLFIRPEKFSGLQLGFSLRHDNLTIPAPAVHETIATAYAVYVNSKYEILNEAILVRHTEPVAGSVFNTSAFYSQFSRAFGKFRPYFRYQYFNAPGNDPVYLFAGPNAYSPLTVTTFAGRINGPTAGVRWDFTEHSALKLQYDRFDQRDLDTENGLTSQIAFTF
ncbi:MAG TPA: hypothetical protein VGG04_01300 [Candidatus Sulfotelmatobacter sp.]|jgi:hypothetical protein